MAVGAPRGNTNAEKWTFEEALNFFNQAINLSKLKIEKKYEYDFIGEIASEQDSYKEIFGYLAEKFPDLQVLHNKLLGRLESNCFYNSKKGNIKEATAIVNLKSNYKWTDRIIEDHTNKGESFSFNNLSDEELTTRINKILIPKGKK